MSISFICESYTTSELLDYMNKKNIVIEDKKHEDSRERLCFLIMKHDFMETFYKQDVNATSFKGTPYDTYLCLLHLQSLHLPDVYVFLNQNISDMFSFNNIGCTWIVKSNLHSHLMIPPELMDKIRNSTTRYIVSILGLVLFDENEKFISGHSNALIFDTLHKKIKRIEPHGNCTHAKYLPELLDFTTKYTFDDYTYYKPYHVFKGIGPQLLQVREKMNCFNDPEGFCIPWIICILELIFSRDKECVNIDFYMYILLHLKNNNKLTQFIRNYCNYIYEKGKRIHEKKVKYYYY